MKKMIQDVKEQPESELERKKKKKLGIEVTELRKILERKEVII